MIAITGASGQLGAALVELCVQKKIPCFGLDHRKLDVSSQESVRSFFDRKDIDCIINCAAYTAVDASEDHIRDAFAVNAFGPWNLAKTGIPVLHVSTDYVFDGLASEPYEADAPSHPISVYGLSKRAGETALLEGGFQGAVVRTAWLYSGRPGTKNFLHTMERLGSERPALRVVNDQVGAPTLAEDLADALIRLYETGAHREPMRCLHITNAGSCSWFDFARAIMEHSGLACRVEPIPSSAYPTRAVRPRYSVLSLKSVERFGIRPRHWREALASVFA